MKPLLLAVVAICLVLSSFAHPENIEQVKELPQEQEAVLEAEESEPQNRKERCTACSSGSLKLNFKSPGDVLAAIQALPGAEVHTQQSYESCSSDKGCAGLKVKDGRVVERFGNVDSFKAAAAADGSNEFQFHAGGALANVFEGGIPGNGPFWWMNENSPFKNTGGNFEKFSKSSSSFSSSSNAAGTGAGGAGFGVSGGVDISANPFLNGDFAKVGFVAGGSEGKPSGFQSSSFEQSAFSSSSKGDVDISKNPFLNGGIKFGQAGFGATGAQGNFGQAGQSNFASQSSSFNGGSANSGATFGGQFAANTGSAGKFGASGYTGSSPTPFTASTAGSNVNLIQNTQKANEFDFEQQTQNVDGAFQSTGNVHAHEHSGGELQQTCAGQGYVCVHKAQCNNGVVNTNGASILQAKTQKQYCNIKNEICCRVEVSALSGAGSLQGSLGVGSATFSGSSNQGSGLFASGQSGQGFAAQGNFGQSASGQTSQTGQASQSGQASFGANSFGASFGSKGTFGQGTTQNFGKGTTQTFGQGTTQNSGQGTTQSFGQSGSGFSASGSFGAGAANRGTTGFESGYNTNKFASSGSSSSNAFGTGIGVTGATENRFGGNVNNEIYKSTSQSNFIESDSSSSGSEFTNIYRPGAVGTGLKPGIPYLPPVDNVNQPTIISSTAIPTTFRPRPTTARPFITTSTAAPGYLPPQISESSNNKETRIPSPNYIDGSLILDQNRTPKPRPLAPPSEIPAGCAAALKCTPIEYCSADGVISNTTVILTRDQEVFRVPLTDCKDIETGRVGKCCRDPYYTDPWPANQLGRWVPGVFGGNDGQYVPDSRGAGNIPRGSTVSPPVTGNVILNNFRTPKPTPTPFVSSQATASSFAKGQYGQGQIGIAGQGSQVTQGQGQYAVRGQGSQVTQGQYGQGQIGITGQGSQVTQGQGQYAVGGQGSQVTQGQYGQGQIGITGQGSQVTQGQGQYAVGGQGSQVTQGQGQYAIRGQGVASQTGLGFGVTAGQGQIVSQGFGTGVRQGFGQGVISGQGQAVSQGEGFGISQGFGSGIRQGFGQAIIEGEGQASSSDQVYRVVLGRYDGNGQCGVLNGQKPYGNRNDLEVDFAEITWQAMVLLQTNKSLLCGGVITRPDVVVTSASCVEGLEAKNVLIKGGEWKLGIDDEPLPFQIVQVKHILRHPFYKAGSYINDVAILVLTENLRLAKNIYPICLPGEAETLDAFYNGAGECIVTGWGKQVLQAHLAGSIMHSLNVSLINPGECQSKLSADYPHLLEQYDQDSCACGQPLNPVNNICKVDIGSALACTTDNQHYVLRGIYSWDSGCQTGNQLAAFYKFDLEWYQWAIGLIESVRFAKYAVGTKVIQGQYSGQLNTGNAGFSGVKTAGFGGVKTATASATASAVKGFKGQEQSQFGFSQFGQGSSFGQSGSFGAEIKAPISNSNSFSASYAEKKVFQSEPQFITYTTKPEIVTFTTKPEYFTYTTKPKLITYTTKPKLITYTTKPQFITYETSGSGTNPQYVAPGVSFNPDFTQVTGAHKHNAQCKCLENGKK